MKKSMVLFIAVWLVLLAGNAFAGEILFVSDTTTDTGIVTVLTDEGHNVTTVLNDYASSNAALQGDLSGYCAVFWSSSQQIHNNQAVITNLESYVTAGGHVFVTGADGVINSYNPIPRIFLEFLGSVIGSDSGYVFSPVSNSSNSLTTGVVDIRGAILPQGVVHISDTDSVCGPLAPGTEGIVESDGNCGDGVQGYAWTLRSLGNGEIAYVMSGNFVGYTDEPLWTDTNMSEYGAYNAAVRNFAYNACNVVVSQVPTMNEWGMIFLSMLTVLSALWIMRKRKTTTA